MQSNELEQDKPRGWHGIRPSAECNMRTLVRCGTDNAVQLAACVIAFPLVDVLAVVADRQKRLSETRNNHRCFDCLRSCATASMVFSWAAT